MRKRQWLFTVCIAAVLLPGLGAAPRYLESLRVGGGYGDRDGGLDIDPDGTLSTNGAILAEGGVTLRGPLRAGTEEHALTTDEGLLDAGALDIPAAQDESLPDDGDTLLIHDASAGARPSAHRADRRRQDRNAYGARFCRTLRSVADHRRLAHAEFRRETCRSDSRAEIRCHRSARH